MPDAQSNGNLSMCSTIVIPGHFLAILLRAPASGSYAARGDCLRLQETGHVSAPRASRGRLRHRTLRWSRRQDGG